MKGFQTGGKLDRGNHKTKQTTKEQSVTNKQLGTPCSSKTKQTTKELSVRNNQLGNRNSMFLGLFSSSFVFFFFSFFFE